MGKGEILMRVFITGITGTLGTAIAKLHHSQGDIVFGCARNESKVVEWLRDNRNIATVFVSDASVLCNNLSDISRLLPSIDRVYHCAAMKHVDICEQQPMAALCQNVEVTKLVASICNILNVPLVFISSDKACLPQGVYGATKLLAERVALQEGAAVVRLGNLIGSSGSVFHTWKNQKNREPIKVTNRNMTRYFIGIEEAAEFTCSKYVGGHVVMPHPMCSIIMGEAAQYFSDIKSAEIVEIGNRPGETLHQWLIAPREPCIVTGDSIVLDSTGDTKHSGMCSHTAPRWDIDQLLGII